MSVSADEKQDVGLDLLARMLKIRRFEERVAAIAASGQGFVSHLYVGQEAVASGVCAALKDTDYISSTHRGHGHVIGKGGDLRRCMAELLGKETGYCRGKGGSMHMADLSLGIIGANGIVGAGIPIACGAGLAAKLRGTDQVSVSFFGDGASNTGTFHESMNVAAVWKLPVVFVCENNGWAQLTRTEATTALGTICQRAAGYGTPGESVDGNDVVAVHEVARAAVERARRGEGPTLIEAHTYRIREHAEGLERFATLRREGEIESWTERDKDPITRHWDRLVGAGVPESQLEALDSQIRADVEAAVEFAQQSPEPPVESAFTGVFSDVVAKERS
jgi:acetoin:2,6-dichlorophenolindophenol oxidoreductase subunit alpha